MEEELKIDLAELQALCIIEGKSEHSSQVKVFHLLSSIQHSIEVVELNELRILQPGLEKAFKSVIFGNFGEKSSSLTDTIQFLLARNYQILC